MIIHTEPRNQTGTGNSRKLRAQNKFPAIIYGKNKLNISIILRQNIFLNIEKNKLRTTPITLIINNNSYIVKVYNIQYHHFKKQILHIDFLYLESSNTSKKK